MLRAQALKCLTHLWCVSTEIKSTELCIIIVHWKCHTQLTSVTLSISLVWVSQRVDSFLIASCMSPVDGSIGGWIIALEKTLDSCRTTETKFVIMLESTLLEWQIFRVLLLLLQTHPRYVPHRERWATGSGRCVSGGLQDNSSCRHRLAQIRADACHLQLTKHVTLVRAL